VIPRPFSIHIPEPELEDLRRRLISTRPPFSLDAEQWSDGTSLSFVRRLLDHWINHFDWRAQEARLNQLPQYRISINEHDIHATLSGFTVTPHAQETQPLLTRPIWIPSNLHPL